MGNEYNQQLRMCVLQTARKPDREIEGETARRHKKSEIMRAREGGEGGSERGSASECERYIATHRIFASNTLMVVPYNTSWSTPQIVTTCARHRRQGNPSRRHCHAADPSQRRTSCAVTGISLMRTGNDNHSSQHSHGTCISGSVVLFAMACSGRPPLMSCRRTAQQSRRPQAHTAPVTTRRQRHS